MDSVFTDVYRRKEWGVGSGSGSTLEFCRPLIQFFDHFGRENRITRMCDLGCGDLQWVPHLLEQPSWSHVTYVGVDCVDGLSSIHKARLAEVSSDIKSRMEIVYKDVSTLNDEELPRADVYWMKDVLQHWGDDEICKFLDQMLPVIQSRKARLLVCNCTGDENIRRTIKAGEFAKLHANNYPFRLYNCKELFVWNGKTVYEIKSRR